MSTEPRILMRSVIRKLALRSMREVAISAADQVYSDFGDLGPAVPFPPFTYGDLGAGAPNMTPDTKATPIPILLGEKTDWNARDPITGAPRSKGMLPGVYLGKFSVDGLPTPPASSGRTLAAAVALMQDLVDRDAADAEWETVLGFNIGSSDIVTLKAMGTVPDTYTRLADVIGYADLDAVLAGGSTPAPSSNEWGILAFGIGEFYRFTGIFGSDLGNGVAENTRDRTELDIAARSGSDLLVPGYSPCPWTAFTITNPDTGRVFDLAAIGVRGALLDDHLTGTVNITANAIGLVDGDGLPIGKLMDGVQFVIENFFIANKSAGPWVTNATTAIQWSDDTYKVNSTSFADRQLQMADALGMTDGPILAWYIDTQAPKTEWMVRFQEWTESKFGTDALGQIRCFGLDVQADTSAWPRVYHDLHVFGPVEMQFGEDRENVSTGVCNYDPDQSKFVGTPITEKNETGIGRYKHREKPGDHRIENPMIADETVLRWLLKQRVARLGLGVKQIVVTGTREWLDYDIGDGVLFNSDDGPGADGYVDNPCIILRRRYDFERQMVTFTLWDVRDVLIDSRFTDGLDRLSEITDDVDAAMVVTDDDDVAPLVLL
jgi:hypothetical protein